LKVQEISKKGLLIPKNAEGITFQKPARKSVLGLDQLAEQKRAAAAAAAASMAHQPVAKRVRKLPSSDWNRPAEPRSEIRKPMQAPPSIRRNDVISERIPVNEEDERQLERDWYDVDETGAVDETHNPFLGSQAKFDAVEAEIEKKKTKRVGAIRQQMNEDNDRWEENRLMTSGVVRQLEVDTDFSNEDEVCHSLLYQCYVN